MTADKIRPLVPEDARAINSQQPIANEAVTPSRAFKPMFAAASQRARAVDCLATAIYYEAGMEGADGQRGVAQVVLNRVRHKSYPNSVCGVVFQGAERRTGCQFTFTCDGSLARAPAPRRLAQARKIAEDALAGSVYAPVGLSTHYHADYVVPYWSPSLLKTAVVGTHIFYRSPGLAGRPSAFAERYAGEDAARPEPTPAPDPVADVPQRLAANPALAAVPVAPEDKAAEIDRFAILDYRETGEPAPSAIDRRIAASVRSAAGASAPMSKGEPPSGIRPAGPSTTRSRPQIVLD
ncbi:cell wall hydrolase [Croceicoccus sp. YJ47]|uniref:cell wall hydrolase n=1 Tax=Croceicoccus sp. YJ47 TaxID=2798724 RepID=UPI00352FFD02